MTVKWVDTHCHLFLSDEQPEALIDRAVAAGVAWMMVPGVDLESTLVARRLAGQYPDRLVWSAGVHPHDASAWQTTGERVTSLAVDAAAIGECGLDYYRNLSPPEIQRPVFQAHLELAHRLGKPVVIHCRDAFADVYDALETAQLGERAILHCWTGGTRWTKRFADLGVTFSYAGPVAFETGETVRLGAEHAPPERTMVETDTPYLAPPPHRGTPNEPAFVAINGAALAKVWTLDLEDVAALTTATAVRVLGGPS